MNTITISFIYLSFMACSNANIDANLIPDVRAIIVSGTTPTDGQLREIRSANARSFIPHLLKVSKTESEIEMVIKLLQNTSHNDNEITILTPSDVFLFCGEPMMLGSVVARVTLSGGGSVVMPFPLKNTSTIETKYDDEYRQLEDENYSFNGNDGLPRPDTSKKWKKAIGYYAKLKNIYVKREQELRRAAKVYDDQFCIMVGFTSAIKAALTKYSYLTKSTKNRKSLKGLCSEVVDSTVLRYKMDIVIDQYNKVFQRIYHNYDDDPQFMFSKGFLDAKILYSAKYNSYPPIIFDSHDRMPFEFANMATGEMGVKSTCDVCSDNKIEDLNEHFGSKENYPIIHLITVKTKAPRAVNEFMDIMNELTYPKSKIIFTILLTFEKIHEERVQSSFMSKREDMINQYKQFSLVYAPDLAVLDLYKKMWNMAYFTEANYTFIVDSDARFDDLEIIEHLLQLNRRMVSPVLLLRPGEEFASNFASDRTDRKIRNNVLTHGFMRRIESREFSYVGTMQVAMATGAVLLNNIIFDEVQVPFHTCKLTCVEEDIECHNFNEKMLKQNCTNSYFSDMEGDELAWGIMFKQLHEQGVISYVNNEHRYGLLVNMQYS